ncbi:MAG TPA: RHS repeat-associated core domain-containing protein, partial [Rhizomicrobium sp.]
REYIWLDDMPVGLVDDTGAGPVLYYIHADHLNRPQKITDASKAVVWDGVFDPFGNAASVTGTVANPLRFPGQYQDTETALAQNWFRDYDATIGRYAESDPVGLNGGINAYGYADQSPLVGFDSTGLSPSGHCFWDCIKRYYGLTTITGLSLAGAIPVSKRAVGVPILRGASPYTNVVSYAGFRFARGAMLPTRVLGTSRLFGLLGRINIPFSALFLTIDEYELYKCTKPCLDAAACSTGGGGGF